MNGSFGLSYHETYSERPNVITLAKAWIANMIFYAKNFTIYDNIKKSNF